MTDTRSAVNDLGLRNPPALRIALVTAGVFILIESVSLFVLTEQTDRFFAWTIAPPLTAAFIGASSIGSLTLVWVSARQQWWVRARFAVVSPLVFLVTTEIVTLVHLDRFHFDSPVFTAQAAAWVWIIFYTLLPIWLLAVAIAILRARVPDPPRIAPVPRWLRALILVQAVPLALVGVALLGWPGPAGEAWPWALTPLTGRAIGAWMLVNCALSLHAAWENDLVRMLAVGATWTVSGALQVVAVLRYPGDFEAASAGGVAYLLFVLSLLVFGVATLVLRRRAFAPAEP
jgi:hypothetical protein